MFFTLGYVIQKNDRAVFINDKLFRFGQFFYLISFGYFKFNYLYKVDQIIKVDRKYTFFVNKWIVIKQLYNERINIYICSSPNDASLLSLNFVLISLLISSSFINSKSDISPFIFAASLDM